MIRDNTWTCRPLMWLAASLLVSACGTNEAETLGCDDLLPSQEASFNSLVELIVPPGAKSCSACHNTKTPLFGYNFEGRGVTYDALSAKPEIIYSQVASGRMPQRGQAWGEADLQLLRSWYCYGGAYEKNTDP